jgi:hypothetical protein
MIAIARYVIYITEEIFCWIFNEHYTALRNKTCLRNRTTVGFVTIFTAYALVEENTRMCYILFQQLDILCKRQLKRQFLYWQQKNRSIRSMVEFVRQEIGSLQDLCITREHMKDRAYIHTYIKLTTHKLIIPVLEWSNIHNSTSVRPIANAINMIYLINFTVMFSMRTTIDINAWICATIHLRILILITQFKN